MAREEVRGDRGAEAARGEAGAATAISVADAYDEHAPALRAYLRGATRDVAAAEDLVHETFVRLLVELLGGRAPIRVRAWLFRVAANLAASRGRHLGVASRRATDLVRRDVVPSPEDEVLDREAAIALRGSLAELPADVRIALLLAAEGFSGAEIAARIGRSEVATRSLICRYRGRLRARAVAA